MPNAPRALVKEFKLERKNKFYIEKKTLFQLLQSRIHNF